MILVEFEIMSSIQRANRKSTDFTIDRILGDDSANPSKLQDSSNFTKTSSSLETVLCANNYCESTSTNFHDSASDSGTLNSEILSRTAHKFVENEIVNSTSPSRMFQCDDESINQKNISSQSTVQSLHNLHWLQCTRYRPPKLPRKSFAGKVPRRRSATHPRIPFTSFQIQTLEDKYKSGAYLSRKDVSQLSTILRIPHSRVCILNIVIARFFFPKFFNCLLA